jgi:hypothetical protein
MSNICPINEPYSFVLMGAPRDHFKTFPPLEESFWNSLYSLQGFTTGFRNDRIETNKLQYMAIKVNEAVLK